MREPTHTCASPSPSPRPYPVSIRAYKKKDYDYLSNFPRMSHSFLRPSPYDTAQDRSDCESELSMTASSAGYSTSVSSASSISSSQSYAKNIVSSMDVDALRHHHHHHHHQQQQTQKQHQPHVLSTQTGTQPPPISVDCAKQGIEMKNNQVDDRSSADVKDGKLNATGDSPGLIDAKDNKLNIAGDSLGLIDDNASVQVKAPVRSKSKPKPRLSNAPVVLPKFGSWDTRNPSSGEAYTLIFRRLRDEKKSGGLPMSTTAPTHSEEEGPADCLSQDSKPEEPLHSNPRVRTDSLRRKAEGKSHQEAAYDRKTGTRWSLCCKASVLDD